MKISAYLHQVLSSYDLREVKDLGFLLKEVQFQIFNILKDEYREKILVKPLISGSLIKGTAINSKFDIDLIIPFQYQSFRNGEDMLENIFDFFENEAEFSSPFSFEQVYDQRVSIGLDLVDQESELLLEIDIVPGMEKGPEDYKKLGDLLLWDSEKGTDILTNIGKQLRLIENKGKKFKQIVKLLKIWKYNYDEEFSYLKSFILELIVVQAFNTYNFNSNSDLWKQLKMVLLFIRDKFPGEQLIDPGNNLNPVNALLSRKEWREIAEECGETLENIEDDPEEIEEYFPEND